ncbi:hypothetical protein [Anaerosinus sp.]
MRGEDNALVTTSDLRIKNHRQQKVIIDNEAVEIIFNEENKCA